MNINYIINELYERYYNVGMVEEYDNTCNDENYPYSAKIEYTSKNAQVSGGW